MKTLIRVVVALVVLAAVAIGVSYLFPSAYRVERSIEINAPAPLVFSYVGDLQKWSEWTPWGAMDPDMVMNYSDPSVGKGSWQEWSGPEIGNGRLEITAYEPPRRVQYDLHFPDFGMSSVGEIVIAPAESGGGVRVTWSDAGELGFNPLNRWMGLFFDRMIGGDFQEGLEKLKSLSEPDSGGVDDGETPAP